MYYVNSFYYLERTQSLLIGKLSIFIFSSPVNERIDEYASSMLTGGAWTDKCEVRLHRKGEPC
jgi:hypothetical protein